MIGLIQVSYSFVCFFCLPKYVDIGVAPCSLNFGKHYTLTDTGRRIERNACVLDIHYVNKLTYAVLLRIKAVSDNKDFPALRTIIDKYFTMFVQSIHQTHAGL